MAQRLLAERATPEVKAKLEKLVLDDDESRKTRMQALLGADQLRPAGDGLSSRNCSTDKDPGFRAWAVRAAGNAGKVDDAVRTKIAGLAKDASPDVRCRWPSPPARSTASTPFRLCWTC